MKNNKNPINCISRIFDIHLSNANHCKKQYNARTKRQIFRLFIIESLAVIIYNEMWNQHNFQLTEKHEVERDKSFNIYKVLDSFPWSNYDLQIEVPR